MNALNSNHARLYRIWYNMVSRCHNTNDKQYCDYGNKGILVCKEWKDDFHNFAWWALMNGYTNELTIDRINNSNGYNPDNCRWATHKQQANNRTNIILITRDGETKTLYQWSEITGINRNTLRQRIFRYKWPLNLAMTKKPDHGFRYIKSHHYN